MQYFWLNEEASIAEFSDFWAQNGQNGTGSAVLESFEDSTKVLPNNYIKDALKSHFNATDDGCILGL